MSQDGRGWFSIIQRLARYLNQHLRKLSLLNVYEYISVYILADIGGMQGMLISWAAFVLTFWNYNYFDNFMVSRVFKIYKPNLNRESKKKS